MIDGQGQPLTDPKRASERFFVPSVATKGMEWANVRFAGQNIEWSCVWQRRGRLDRGLENPQQHGAGLPMEVMANICQTFAQAKALENSSGPRCDRLQSVPIRLCRSALTLALSLLSCLTATSAMPKATM